MNPLVVRYDERHIQDAAQTQQVLRVIRTEDFAEKPEADRRVGYGTPLVLQRSVQGRERARHMATVRVIRLRDFVLPFLYQCHMKCKTRMAVYARNKEVIKALAALAIDQKDPVVNPDSADVRCSMAGPSDDEITTYSRSSGAKTPYQPCSKDK